MTDARKRNLFVVIEGLDGSGKTSVASAVAKELNAVCLHTPSAPFDTLRRAIDDAVDLDTRFLYYLASVFHASSAARERLAVSDVVCDRYVASTVAYHSAMGARLARTMRPTGILRPDVAFFLSVGDESVRQNRISGRGRKTPADEMLEVPVFRRRLLRAYAKFPMQRIETSDLTFPQVVEAVLVGIARRRQRST